MMIGVSLALTQPRTANGPPPPVNAAPVVAAGPDQSLALTDHLVTANLAGSVTDDTTMSLALGDALGASEQRQFVERVAV